jgi:hypothetical protein
MIFYKIFFRNALLCLKNKLKHLFLVCIGVYRFFQRIKILGDNFLFSEHILNREKKNSSLGGFEPPTFRLTAERASRLRHRDIWYTCVRICDFNFGRLELLDENLF